MKRKINRIENLASMNDSTKISTKIAFMHWLKPGFLFWIGSANFELCISMLFV